MRNPSIILVTDLNRRNCLRNIHRREKKSVRCGLNSTELLRVQGRISGVSEIRNEHENRQIRRIRWKSLNSTVMSQGNKNPLGLCTYYYFLRRNIITLFLIVSNYTLCRYKRAIYYKLRLSEWLLLVFLCSKQHVILNSMPHRYKAACCDVSEIYMSSRACLWVNDMSVYKLNM
jgi:hypothetical protein